MVDLNESPGVWHGIAEGHVWLSDKERLELALKACDLYLAMVTQFEEELSGRDGAAARDNTQ